MRIDISLADDSGNVGTGSIVMGPAAKPLGPTGTFKLVFSDDFATLDTAKWRVQEDRDMNGVKSRASNVSVVDGKLRLQVSQDAGVTYGAVISSAYDWGDDDTTRFWLQRGDVVEAMVYGPGVGTQYNNWGGFWTSGKDWPRSGENDLFEYGPELAVNYHGIQSNSANNTAEYVSNGPTLTGYVNKWTRVTMQRTTDNKTKVWYDGTLVRTVDTSNREYADAKQAIIFSLGYNSTPALGNDGAFLVDWVKAYRPA